MASVHNKKMRGRAIFVAALLILLGFGLVIRQLYIVQIVKGDSYKQTAMSNQLRATTHQGKQGDDLFLRRADSGCLRYLMADRFFTGGYYR